MADNPEYHIKFPGCLLLLPGRLGRRGNECLSVACKCSRKSEKRVCALLVPSSSPKVCDFLHGQLNLNTSMWNFSCPTKAGGCSTEATLSDFATLDDPVFLPLIGQRCLAFIGRRIMAAPSFSSTARLTSKTQILLRGCVVFDLPATCWLFPASKQQ